METKRLQILHEVAPNAATIAAVVNPNNPQADEQLHELDAAARTLRVKIAALMAGTPKEIDAAFANLVEQRWYLPAQSSKLLCAASAGSLDALPSLKG